MNRSMGRLMAVPMSSSRAVRPSRIHHDKPHSTRFTRVAAHAHHRTPQHSQERRSPRFWPSRSLRERVVCSAAGSSAGDPSSSDTSPATPAPELRSDSSQRGSTRTLFRRLATQLKSLLVLTVLLAAWYSSNIFFNIYNKQVLQVFPHATTCTFIHLLVASSLMGLAWLVRLKKAPIVNRRTFEAVFPLSILHLIGFLTTNMSLGAVNVSLTHTIKSLEPFFTVFLSWMFLGSIPTLPVLLTLIPIVAGVVIASATEVSFNWYGFATAMGSNLAFQSRNVISKKYMVESSLESLEDSKAVRTVLDEINLFACITIAATALMVPVVLALDGQALLSMYSAASGSVTERLSSIMSLESLQRTVMAGICRTVDVLASYALLSRLNPVTHSVGNCVKRVVVIGVSIIFFGIQASYLNIVGTAMALSGVFAYSMAKRMSKDRPDLRASLRATIKLQNFLSSLVPEFIKEALEKRAQAKVKAKEEAPGKKAKSSTDSQDEPEYFL